MAYIGPDSVYLHALRAIPKVTGKFPIADRVAFARILVGLAFQESCIRKNTANQVCFDTEARPLDKNGRAISSALGLTQVLERTQGWLEKIMKWPKQPLSRRTDPQYAMDLAAAYLAYLYSGGMKTPKGSWYKALVAYHDGHYSAKGAGHAYATMILKHIQGFDFAAIARRTSNPSIALLEYTNRTEFR
jgi:hypothetical protein